MVVTSCLQGILIKSHTLQLHVFSTKSTTCLPLSLLTSYTNLPDGIVQKPLDSNFNFSNLSCMLGHNLPRYFSMPIFFVYSPVISLTPIHSSINKMGLSLVFTIIRVKTLTQIFYQTICQNSCREVGSGPLCRLYISQVLPSFFIQTL